MKNRKDNMKQGKLEDRLQMRRLTVDDTAQYNALLRYAFQVTDNELASLGWNQKEMERSKKPVLKKTESFGWFDGDKLASQISVYPMQVNLFGTMYSMGGVTGVATYPEYMNHGLMSSLKKALLNMQENHQCVSMLSVSDSVLPQKGLGNRIGQDDLYHQGYTAAQALQGRRYG